MSRRIVLAATLALIAASAPPAVAVADSPPQQTNRQTCRTLAKQIAHFHGIAERARARGNPLWERATQEHILRLRQRQRQRCPQDVPPGMRERLASALRTLGELSRVAALWRAF